MVDGEEVNGTGIKSEVETEVETGVETRSEERKAVKTNGDATAKTKANARSSDFFSVKKRAKKQSSDEQTEKSHDQLTELTAAEIIEDTVVYWCRKSQNGSGLVRVAAFDMDSTLIVTKSGSAFARGAHDWKLMANVSEKIAEIAKTHVVVIFTNQGGVVPKKSMKSFVNLDTRIRGVCEQLPGVSHVFAAAKSAETKYRKPKTGMWQLFTGKIGSIDIENSFFVGDAAGRPQDHSSADIGFAKAVGLSFFTPEEYFN